MPYAHPLERRATALASALTKRISTMSSSLLASQGRIPFHTQLPQAQALEWWAQHRYDGMGAQVLANLNPTAIASLDTALTQHAQNKEAMGLPQETDALPGPAPDPTQGGMPSGAA